MTDNNWIYYSASKHNGTPSTPGMHTKCHISN